VSQIAIWSPQAAWAADQRNSVPSRHMRRSTVTLLRVETWSTRSTDPGRGGSGWRDAPISGLQVSSTHDRALGVVRVMGVESAWKRPLMLT